MRDVIRSKVHVPPPVDPLPSAINTFEDFCMFMSSWVNYMYHRYRGTIVKRGSMLSGLILLFRFGIISITL